MFGIGGSEILVILVIALLFLGPDKLPEAAKTISKGIRDLKKQSRALQQQIESDEKIGGAIRDLKSALRGEDAPVRPPVRREPPMLVEPPVPSEQPGPTVTLPELVGEPDPEVEPGPPAADIGSLIKPPAGTVAKAAPAAAQPPAVAQAAPAAGKTAPGRPPPLPRVVKPEPKNG